MAVIIAIKPKPKPKLTDKKDTTKFPDRPDDKYFPDQNLAPSPNEGPTDTVTKKAGGAIKYARGGGVEKRGKTRGKFV